MQGEPPTQASAATGALFLSYASQDAEAARRICDALRTAGIEVWFDQSELRGGDAWDAAIRKQIKTCALFIAVISRHAHDRIEGYFRLEWKLAVDRSHLIAPDQTFLLPVAIDDTPQSDERIPDRFRELQWTRLPDGEASPAFVERVQQLLSHETSSGQATARPVSPTVKTAHQSGASAASSWRFKAPVWLISILLVGVLAYIAVDKLRISGRTSPPPLAAPPAQVAARTPATAAAFNPPPRSIAVLPFVNMSGDKDQEYFSDGLTEELLNSLSRISELQVAARTSSFSFQGEHPDIATVAHKLNVGAVLEGSVRRSAHTVRVTAQLVNGVTGFHLWSETYDRDLGDVLKLQTEIATAVAGTLKVTLIGDEAAKIELGGTRNPAALDAYLRATKIYWDDSSVRSVETAIEAYSEAIRLDPNFALAYSSRSIAFSVNASYATTLSALRAGLNKAQVDAHKAISLAPDLGEGHAALAFAYLSLLDFPRANEEYERAFALASGNARVLRACGKFSSIIGRGDLALPLLRRAAVLDPLNIQSHTHIALALVSLRRYPEAIAALTHAEALNSQMPNSQSAGIGDAYYLLGDFEAARVSCEKTPEDADSQICLALTYDKLGRHADAEAMLAKIRAHNGDSRALDYAAVYAQWGKATEALKWLDTAMRLRDPQLAFLKMLPVWDPLRQEPRFQAIVQALKFPTN